MTLKLVQKTALLAANERRAMNNINYWHDVYRFQIFTSNIVE
jgi:hypothetical protein